MFNNDRKYRGLGFDISKATSLKEALEMSRLNWKVSEMPIETNISKTNTRLVIPGWKALVRPDKSQETGYRILDVPTAGYVVSQNEDQMQTFFEIAKLGDMKLETAGAISGGERIFAVAKISGEFHFPGVSDAKRIDHGQGQYEKDDATYLKILLGAAHVSGQSNTIDVLAERQICTNGARISEGVGRWRFIHKRKFGDNDREEIKAFVARAQDAFKNYEEKAMRLRNTEFAPEITELYLVELEAPSLLKEAKETVAAKHKKLDEKSADFGRFLIDHALHKKDKVLDKGKYTLPLRTMLAAVDNNPGAELAAGTGWNAYNTVTWYIDHAKGRTADTGLQNALYGQGAKTKMDALALAVNYCDRLEM